MARQTPYTYLIGWKSHNKYYYGVRYAKNCDPSEFWKTYFTSSNYVQDFYKNHGNPDIIEIRKTFQDAVSAIKWEKKVLKRMKVLIREDFLNANIAGSFIFTEEILNKMRLTKKNNPSAGTSGRIWITDGIDSSLIHRTADIPTGWYKGRTVATLLRNASANTLWITNGKNNKRIEVNDEIPKGWQRGHTVADKNSLRGSAHTMWITDGISNKKVDKNIKIPNGWERGRSNSFPSRWSKK